MRKNKELLFLLTKLRKAAKEHNAPIWRRVAELLNKPKRRSIAVNISKLNRYTNEGDWVVVLGRCLGAASSIIE
jgi:large subunit ribosomal protein L18e